MQKKGGLTEHGAIEVPEILRSSSKLLRMNLNIRFSDQIVQTDKILTVCSNLFSLNYVYASEEYEHHENLIFNLLQILSRTRAPAKPIIGDENPFAIFMSTYRYSIIYKISYE